MHKTIEIRTRDFQMTEKWELSDKFCPHCGKKTLWTIHNIAAQQNYNGIKGIKFQNAHICINCKSKFDGTSENLEHIKIELEWDLQRLHQLNGLYI